MIVARYMTADKANRIVAHLFSPLMQRGAELDDDTLGAARLATRDEPGDVWGQPRDLAAYVTYADWKNTVEAQGFTFEERS